MTSSEDKRTDPPRSRFSLRLRLTLWTVVVFSLIQWASAGLFYLYFVRANDDMFSRMLLERSAVAAEQISEAIPNINRQTADSIAGDTLRGVWLGRFTVDVFADSTTGSVFGEARSRIDPTVIPKALFTDDDKPFLTMLGLDVLDEPDPGARNAPTVFRAVRHGDQRLVLALAVNDAYLRNQRTLTFKVLLLGSIVGPIAAGVAGWLIAGIAVAPFAKLGGVAQRLKPDALEEKIEVQSADSEVAELTRQLDLARESIREGFAAQERFLSNVSHEIKTPIATMLIEAQTIDRNGVPEHLLTFLSSVEEEMLKLGQLVESFLTLTRVRDGKGIAILRPYAANDLVSDSVDHCLPMARQHDVCLVPRLLDDFDCELVGDPELLRTMVDNLVRNAMRFAPPNTAVTIELEREDDTIIVRVTDEGPGIPEDRLASIFDRFATVAGTPRSGRGHGLGLSIARGIAELHRGTIAVRNLDVGCAFEIRLPVHLAEPPEPADESEEAEHA